MAVESVPSVNGIDNMQPCSVRLVRMDDSKIQRYMDRREIDTFVTMTTSEGKGIHQCKKSGVTSGLHVPQRIEAGHVFKCSKCKRQFSEKAQLGLHMLIHSDNKPQYTCDVCKRSFPRKPDLQRHLKIHSENREKYACEICGKEFFSTHGIDYHMEWHKNANTRPLQYPCEECGKLYASKSGLFGHMNTCHELIRFICEECGKVCRSRNSYNIHKRKHREGTAKIKCNQCEKLITKQCMGQHVNRVHNPNRPPRSHACPQCGKMFYKRNVLEQHLKTHQNPCKVPCPECGRLIFKKSYGRHMLDYHSGVALPYTCQICQKGFRKEANLRQHQINHREKTFRCPLCDKGFVSNGEVNRHMKGHLNKREFTCDICSKSFISKGRLRQHMETHKLIYRSGGPNDAKGPEYDSSVASVSTSQAMSFDTNDARRKTYSCHLCGKSFLSKHYIARHIESVHDKVKHHSCEKCGKGFNLKSHLMRHMLVHNGRNSSDSIDM